MKNEAWRVKECSLCGFPFKASREDASYCTPACRQRAQRVRLRKMTREEAIALARDARAAFSRANVEAETRRLNRLGKK